MKICIAALAFATLLTAADADWIASAGGVATRDAAGNITRVDLRNSWVTDGDLAQLAALPKLAYLDLSQTRITDHGMQALKNAPGIVELNLYFAEQITDEGMAAVKNWKHLKKVNLRGTKITDMSLEHLATVETLESIDVGYAQVTDVGLDRLTTLPNLKELTVGGNKLTDMGLVALRQMPNLTYLDISGTQRTDSGLWSVSLTEFGVDTISKLKDLRTLRADGMNLSARSVEKLKGLAKLERISCQGCRRLGDDAVPVLATLPALAAIDVKGTLMTEKGVAELRKAKSKVQVFYGAYEGPKIPGRGE